MVAKHVTLFQKCSHDFLARAWKFNFALMIPFQQTKEELNRVVQLMAANGQPLPEETFNHLIRVFTDVQNDSELLKSDPSRFYAERQVDIWNTLDEMKRRGLQLSFASLHYMLRFLCRVFHEEEAWHVYEEMIARDMPITSFQLNEFIQMYGYYEPASDDHEDFEDFGTMDNSLDNTEILSQSSVRVTPQQQLKKRYPLTKQQRNDGMKRVAAEFSRLKISLDIASYTLLIKSVCRDGAKHLLQTREIVREVNEREVEPDPLFYCALLQFYASNKLEISALTLFRDIERLGYLSPNESELVAGNNTSNSKSHVRPSYFYAQLIVMYARLKKYTVLCEIYSEMLAKGMLIVNFILIYLSFIYSLCF
jgi:pentatricopeptide repeat protein